MKPWYQSKTITFNILYVIVAIAGIFGFSDFQASPALLEGLTLLGGIINLILRFETTKPIK